MGAAIAAVVGVASGLPTVDYEGLNMLPTNMVKKADVLRLKAEGITISER